MSRNLLAVIFSTSLLIACGGGTPPAEDASDAVEDSADDAADDAAGGEGTKSDGVDPGGIVRDADGDGVSDDKEKSGCESKNETQCKINMECAWSDEGTCVKARAGM